MICRAKIVYKIQPCTLQTNLENENTRKSTTWIKTKDCEENDPAACNDWKIKKDDEDTTWTIKGNVECEGTYYCTYQNLIIHIILIN